MSRSVSISLRDARRLDQEVDSLVRRIVGDIKHSKDVSVFETVTESTFSEPQKDIGQRLDKALDLTGFRFALRASIGHTNSTSGINGMTSKLAELEARLALVQGITQIVTVDPYSMRRGGRNNVTPVQIADEINVERINIQLETMREALKNTAGAQAISVNLLTKDMADNIAKSVTTIKREVTKTKDAIAALNQSTKVSVFISDSVDKLLNEFAVTVE
jgi:hypothetical protein